MNETLEQLEREWQSELFSNYVNGSDGEADGLPTLDQVQIDSDMRHPDWPTAEGALRLIKQKTEQEPETHIGISSYGYRVYRDYLEEEPAETVYLDPRVFLWGTDLVDVLAEAAHCAIDDGKPELVVPFLRGMIDTAAFGNFADMTMRKYLSMVMRSQSLSAIRTYVDFMNNNTVKGPDDAKAFLKTMAHAIKELPDTYSLYAAQDDKVDTIAKQVLLEDVGHAWIRKSMPVAEIDWLP